LTVFSSFIFFLCSCKGHHLFGYKYESYTVISMGQEESDVAVVGTKGQIVIPQRFRKELAITPNTKLVVYRRDDKLVVTKLRIPPLVELKDLFKEINQQNKGKKKPSEQEILDEIQEYRAQKRGKQGA
jgi:AbrB family looped-hinge helix DNA binding protein